MGALVRAYEDGLRDLRRAEGVAGIVVISRDGHPLLVDCLGIQTPEVFCAMQAASLGAAEVALGGGAAHRRVSLLLELEDRRYLSRGVTSEIILTVQLAPDADWARVIREMDAAGAVLEPGAP